MFQAPASVGQFVLIPSLTNSQPNSVLGNMPQASLTQGKVSSRMVEPFAFPTTLLSSPIAPLKVVTTLADTNNLLRHPAPLPNEIQQGQTDNAKLPPPTPILRVNQKNNSKVQTFVNNLWVLFCLSLKRWLNQHDGTK